MFCRFCQKLQVVDANFWQARWDRIVDFWGDDEEHFVVNVTTLYSFCLYWIFGGIFYAMNFVPFFHKFRHQEDKPIDYRKMMSVNLISNRFELKVS